MGKTHNIWHKRSSVFFGWGVKVMEGGPGVSSHIIEIKISVISFSGEGRDMEEGRGAVSLIFEKFFRGKRMELLREFVYLVKNVGGGG